MSLTIATGKSPEIWAAARLKDVREIPELTVTADGRLNCWTGGLCFVVERRGDSAQSVAYDVPEGNNGIPRLVPLSRSASGKLRLWKGSAKFSKPGTYTVRAVAGRMVSDPVTVVVEGPEAPAAADPHKPAGVIQEPAAAGPQPKWKAGDKTLGAIDGASGKMLWMTNLSFPVGNVVQNANGQWEATSQDGAKRATLDAATGKMLREEKLGQ